MDEQTDEQTDERRILRAEQFLQEAVYRSRGAQALGAVFHDPEKPGSCGLGAKAAVVLSLDAKGRELFEEIWPELSDESRLEVIRDATRDWVRCQDAHDRRRNHFMKAFRHEHGFDRTGYSPEETERWESGLREINDDVSRELRRAAEALVRIA